MFFVDFRKDIRQMEHVPGKSINLAMSVRGLTGLRMVKGTHGDHKNLGDHVAHDYGIPMFARMIHNLDGSTYAVPYGKSDQCILSVGRRYIPIMLYLFFLENLECSSGSFG